MAWGAFTHTGRRGVQWIALAAALIAAIVTIPVALQGQGTPYDEYTHFDFIARVAVDHTIPLVNDKVGQTSLQQYACSGGAFGNLQCGAAVQDPARAPWDGDSAATNNQPTYYVLTAVPTWLTYHLTPAHWFTSARIANTIWVMLLAYLCVVLACAMGAIPAAAFGGALLVAVNPMMILQGSSVSPDPASCVAALACVLVWWLLRNRTSTWLRVGLTILTVLVALSVKETAVVGLFAVVAMEGARAFVRRDQPGAFRREPGSGTPSWTSRLAPVVVLALAVPVLHVLERSFVGPLLRGSLPGNSTMADSLAVGQPGLSQLLAGPYFDLSKVFTSPTGQQAGLWFGAYAIALFMLAAGGTLALLLQAPREPRTSDASFIRAMRGGIVAYFIFFPALFIMATAQVSAAFWQPRYILPGAALALITVTLGIGRRAGIAWAAMGIIMLAVFLLFVVGGAQVPA